MSNSTHDQTMNNNHRHHQSKSGSLQMQQAGNQNSSTSSTKKSINIDLVNGESLHLSYDKSTRLYTLFDAACLYAKLSEHDIFGLCIYVDNFFHFLDLQEKVVKINFKSLRKKAGFFKSSSELSLSTTVEKQIPSRPILHLRVHYYVRWHTLRERSTKHFYYEQLKWNLLHYKILASEEIYFQLAALALQADYGNCLPAWTTSTQLQSGDQTSTAGGRKPYFYPKQYFPHWDAITQLYSPTTKIVSRHGVSYLRRHVPTLHQSHVGMSRAEAEFRFVRLASAQPSNVNMHLCRLLERAPFDKKADTPLWFGVSPAGIELHQERAQGFLAFLSTITWTQIGRLSFKKSRLLVTMKGGRLLALEAASSSQAEHLFLLCERMHLFQTAAQMSAPCSPESLEHFERRDYRESYVYTDEADLENRRRTDSNSSSSHSWGFHTAAAAAAKKLNNSPPTVDAAPSSPSGMRNHLYWTNGDREGLPSNTPTIDNYSIFSGSSTALAHMVTTPRPDSTSTGCYDYDNASLPRPPRPFGWSGTLSNGRSGLVEHPRLQIGQHLSRPLSHGDYILRDYEYGYQRPVSLNPSRHPSEASSCLNLSTFAILKRQTSQPDLPNSSAHTHAHASPVIEAPPRLLRRRTPEAITSSASSPQPSFDFPMAPPPPVAEESSPRTLRNQRRHRNHNNNIHNNWKTMDLTQLQEKTSWTDDVALSDKKTSDDGSEREDSIHGNRFSWQCDNRCLGKLSQNSKELSQSVPRLYDLDQGENEGPSNQTRNQHFPCHTTGRPLKNKSDVTRAGCGRMKAWQSEILPSPSSPFHMAQPFQESKVFFTLGFLRKRSGLLLSNPTLNIASTDTSHLESFTC